MKINSKLKYFSLLAKCHENNVGIYQMFRLDTKYFSCMHIARKIYFHLFSTPGDLKKKILHLSLRNNSALKHIISSQFSYWCTSNFDVFLSIVMYNKIFHLQHLNENIWAFESLFQSYSSVVYQLWISDKYQSFTT